MPMLTVGGGDAGAEDIEAREACGAVDQRIGQEPVRRDRGERDVERRLRPVDRAHEVAQRDEAPGRDHRPGETQEIARGERRGFVRLAGGEQDVVAPELRDVDRDADHHRGPQPDAQRAAHHARLARAIGLRGQRGDRRDHAHADDEAGEQHQLREADGGERVVAQPADQREIGGHHGDLAELA